MMNVLGLSLVITSLAAAGILSPSPNIAEQQGGVNTIVKEGHRVVVVEYDEGGHQNTKVSISPPAHDHVLDAKDRIKEASSVLPNLGQGISHQAASPAFLHTPKELICDAYGKCKNKIAHVAGKTKDKARHVHEYAQDTVETVKDHIASNVSNARDTLRHLKDAIFKPLPSLGLGSMMGLANLLGFATAYGMCVWVTFLSSYVQSRAMPRQQFAVVQSKIYPVYFRAMAYSIGLALFGHVFAHAHTNRLQTYNLLASLVTLFLNSLYLEPRATKLMFERLKIEKEEGRGRSEDHVISSRAPKEADQLDAVRSRIIKLNDKLKKLNSYSSFLNILNLMSLTWHLVYLAQRLHHIC